jgi:serine/threonine-protein kinase
VSTAAVNLPPEDLRPGQVVDGRYRVEARLAHGGMATVYRAFDDRLDRPVALKVIDAGLARRPEYVARFIREAKSAARLSHPNIVGVYDQSAIRDVSQGEEGTLAYLAMEYVPGSTLRQALGRRGRLSPRQAIQVMDAMLAGLGAAHRAGIVHRDIKPENVLVNDAVLAQTHSYAAALKVTDFGLARSVAPGAEGTSLAGSLPGGGLIGTASYLAPELVRFGTCDQRSDVYSAGIVLFELLTGRKPFTAGTPMQVAQLHVTHRVPAPSSLVPGLDPAIDALVARATAREPGERPADANALRTQLRAVYANLPDAALDFSGAAAQSETTQQLQGAGIGATRVDAAPTRVDAGTRVNPVPAAGAPRGPLPPVAPRRDPDEPYRYATAGGPRRRYRGLIIFLAVLLLAAATALGAWLYGSTHYQSMPDLTGLSKAQAEQALANDGLKYKLASASSTTVQSGDVVSTSPGSGRPIADGGTVTLTISSGPAQVSVPDVQGLSQSDATDKLTSAGLKVSVASGTQASSTVAAGDVASYSPDGTVTQGTTITLTLSAGAEQVTVPKVTGMSVEDATQELQQAGFRVVTHHITLLFGTVVNQDPGAGESAQAGSTVTLYY